MRPKLLVALALHRWTDVASAAFACRTRFVMQRFSLILLSLLTPFAPVALWAQGVRPASALHRGWRMESMVQG